MANVGDDYGREAAHFFSDLVWNESLMAKVCCPSPSLASVPLPPHVGVPGAWLGVTAAPLLLQIHSRDEKNRLVVTLFQDDSDVTVSERLLTAGLARVSKSQARRVEMRFERAQPGADKDKVCACVRVLSCRAHVSWRVL